MNVDQLRNNLSVRSKNGLSFIVAASVVWIFITIVFLQSISLQTKNISMLLLTGLTFPFAVGFSSLMKADWKLAGHPLSQLGLLINLAQFMYFPIVFWAFVKNPAEMVIFFAVITGAHLFPYGWFYDTNAYYIMAPVISIVVIVLAWSLETTSLWLIPLAMTLLLVGLSLWLLFDYKRKQSEYSS